jgi:hypothetical protein
MSEFEFLNEGERDSPTRRWTGWAHGLAHNARFRQLYEPESVSPNPDNPVRVSQGGAAGPGYPNREAGGARDSTPSRRALVVGPELVPESPRAQTLTPEGVLVARGKPRPPVRLGPRGSPRRQNHPAIATTPAPALRTDCAPLPSNRTRAPPASTRGGGFSSARGRATSSCCFPEGPSRRASMTSTPSSGKSLVLSLHVLPGRSPI